jgi:hypothetical protein
VGDCEPRTVRRGLGLADVLVCVVLLAMASAILIPALLRTGRERSCGPKCSNKLRQIALSAIQYADDKRFTPHVGRLGALDGDNDSADTPRSIRALVWYGYHDNPEGFACPSSSDLYVPIQDTNVRENMRLWMWSAGQGSNTVPPWREGKDPSLRETRELSYAYTRRGYNRNLSSEKTLAADRAMRLTRAPKHAKRLGSKISAGDEGNHDDGWNVAKADATVQFVPSRYEGTRPPGATLRGTGKGEGFLPISDLGDPGDEHRGADPRR